MDLENAEPAASRRRLIGTVGALGVAGAAVLATAQTASAAPSAPTANDRELLIQAMRLELTARDLYTESINAGLPDDIALPVQTFADNHAAYADAIAGIAGFSARGHSDAVFDRLRSSFATGDVTAMATAAVGVENSAVATHSDLFGRYDSTKATILTASIIVVEARMATVFSDINETSRDLDALFEPQAEALQLIGGATS